VRFLLLIFVVLLIVVAPITLFFLSGGTGIEVRPQVKAIGASTPVHVVLNNPHGVRSVRAILEQDGKSYSIPGPQEPAHRFRFFKNAKPASVTLNVGKDNAAGLHDGKAKLTIETQSNDLRGQTDAVSSEVEVITQPPHVVAAGSLARLDRDGQGVVSHRRRLRHARQHPRVGGRRHEPDARQLHGRLLRGREVEWCRMHVSDDRARPHVSRLLDGLPLLR